MSPKDKILKIAKNKKIVAISLSVFALAIAGYFAFLKPVSVNLDKKVLSANIENYSDPELDSDGDGLKNWEEKYYGTDIFNPDTDGDGFSDGDEVKNGFDPTIKGDGEGSDRIKKIETVTAEKRPAASIKENITASLFAGLMNKKPEEISAENLNEEELLALLEDSFLTSLDSQKQAGEAAFLQALDSSTKALEDFLNPPLPGIVQQNPEDTQKIREEYAMALIGIMRKYYPSEPKNLLVQAQEYMETKDPAELDNSAKNYKNMIEEIIKLRPPKSFYDFHVKELKALQSTFILTETIKNFEEDQLKAGLFLTLSGGLLKLSLSLADDFNKLIAAYKINI